MSVRSAQVRRFRSAAALLRGSLVTGPVAFALAGVVDTVYILRAVLFQSKRPLAASSRVSPTSSRDQLKSRAGARRVPRRH